MRISMKRIRESERLPRFSGVVRYEPDTRSITVLPMPLNILVRWCLSLVERCRGLAPSWLEEKLEERCSKEWARGYKVGLEDGKALGRTEIRTIIEDMLVRRF